MKRLIAILLSLFIVGIPAVVWLQKEHQAQVGAAILAEEELRRAEEEMRGRCVGKILRKAEIRANRARFRAAELIEEKENAKQGLVGIELVAYWQSQNRDVVGYLYSPGTVISYPIVQGKNNEYYLNHDIYGNSDVSGCVMLEYLNASDFSDNNSIIYGHHMKAGTMLASIDRYKDPSFYPDHAFMYLYTPEQTYRLDLIAGYSCPHDDEVFCTGLTDAQISRFKKKSTFKTNLKDTKGSYVTLCTCSYEHEDWRYVVVCKKVAI